MNVHQKKKCKNGRIGGCHVWIRLAFLEAKTMALFGITIGSRASVGRVFGSRARNKKITKKMFAI